MEHDQTDPILGERCDGATSQDDIEVGWSQVNPCHSLEVNLAAAIGRGDRGQNAIAAAPDANPMDRRRDRVPRWTPNRDFDRSQDFGTVNSNPTQGWSVKRCLEGTRL
jgi:hypothetical protein